MDAVSHLLRRSRSRSLAVAGHHAPPINVRLQDALEAKKENETITEELVEALQKRLTPEQVEAIQSSARASALRAASQTGAAPARLNTPSFAAAATTSTRQQYVFSDKFAHSTSTAAAPITTSSAVRAVTSAAAPSSAAPVSSSRSKSAVAVSSAPPAVPSSSSAARPSSSAVRSSSSTTIVAAPSVAPTTSTATVRTITQTPSTVSSTAIPSASLDANAAAAAAAAGKSSDDGVSTGTIAGIVVGVLAGLVFIGALIGWLYRKHSVRSYSNAKAPWSKIEDDDITPFPINEKYGHNDQDDIYGNNGAPVIGSRRALAQARQNAFNEDGSFRPNSDYLAEPGPNRAGVGSGLAPDYGAYPSFPSSFRGVNNDPRRSSVPSMGPPPSPYTFNKQFPPHAMTAPGNTRQLVDPHDFPEPDLAPHALGRPLPPTDHFTIAEHEDYADMPDPLTPTNVDDGDYTPRTATTMGEWGGNPHPQPDFGVPVAAAPAVPRYALSDNVHAPSAAAQNTFPVAAPAASSNVVATGLPSFEPMSPLMAEFDLRRQSGQPLAMYEDEKSQQKRMYGEVASAARVPEPPTPKSATADARSTFDTSPSFSGHEPMPARLPPALVVNPPQPYVHGRPLSPLNEVATPMSTATGRTISDHPVPSSSILHEANPFERTLLGAKQNAAPLYTASSAGATGFPSPAYPPPSPGGMSVPGSVTDSPQRWDGYDTRGRRVQSMFDEEDAYGGI